MDSVTQIALGGAVGYAVLGNRLGSRSLVIGAVFGTLPDLDVLVDYGGAVENFVYHRGFSHSLIVHLLAAPLFAWLLRRFSWARDVTMTRWGFAIFLMLSTHALLDALTVYGTQLLWPLTDYPFGVSSLFIIDPLYTLPLLCSMLVIPFFNNKRYMAIRINLLALMLSSSYAAWSIGAKGRIDVKIEKALNAQRIDFQAYESTPSPFNTLLWRAVATTEDGHYEIYASIFDHVDEISIYFYPTQRHLIEPMQDNKRIQQLTTFTKGLYGVYQAENSILLSDLRMGIEGAYVFTFKVGKVEDGQVSPFSFEQLSDRPPLAQLELILNRIWDPNVELSLSARNEFMTMQINQSSHAELASSSISAYQHISDCTNVK